MAEGFARHYGKEMSLRARGEAISVYSAGSKPSGIVNPTAAAVMKERGIDISAQVSKGFDALPEGEIDMLITMGCGDSCPSVPAKKKIDWQIQDPKSQPIDVFRAVRDEIEKRILHLLSKKGEEYE